MSTIDSFDDEDYVPIPAHVGDAARQSMRRSFSTNQY